MRSMMALPLFAVLPAGLPDAFSAISTRWQLPCASQRAHRLHVANQVHIRHEAGLRTVNGGQSQGLTRMHETRPRRMPPAPTIQRKPSSATLSAASRAKTRLTAASAVASKRSFRFLVEFAFCTPRGSSRKTGGTFGVCNQLAQSQQDVLEARQSCHARAF